MRKRSEIRNTAPPPSAPEDASAAIQDPAPSPAAPALPVIVLGLKQLGFDVTLVEAESWGPLARQLAAETVRTGGRVVHDFLAQKRLVAPPAAAEPPMPPPAAPEERPVVVRPNAKNPVGVDPGLERVIERVYAVDVEKTYEDLERNLAIGDERADRGTLLRHADRGEERARQAFGLYLRARLDLERWEAEAKSVTAALRDRALSSLEAEKTAGERKKAITNEDVEHEMARQFPDEVTAQRVKREKLKGTVEALERLAALWRSRPMTLVAMLGHRGA